MAKIAIKDITEGLGFSASQFGGVLNFDNAGGYIDDIITDAAREVEDAVGATRYAAAADGGTSSEQLDFTRITRAEKCLVAAELYRRRINYVDANMVAGRASKEVLDQQQSFIKQANSAEAMAWKEIELITGERRDYGASVGSVETGVYS